jgi:hypothetical protein
MCLCYEAVGKVGVVCLVLAVVQCGLRRL